MIIEIIYQNPEHTHIALTLDNSEGHSGVYEGTRAWRKHVQPYLDGGGVIGSYIVPPTPRELSDKEKLELKTGLTITKLKTLLNI